MKLFLRGNVKVQAILQARIGSTRLPGKIFEPIGDKSAIGWAVSRLQASKLVERIVIATTTNDEDDQVEQFATDQGVLTFRGSEDDVLGRFIGALKMFPADTIVRATGDNPLIDVDTLDHMIAEHIKNGADHTTLAGQVPVGSAAEIVSNQALQIAWEKTSEKPYREHVTPYIYENRDMFRVIHVVPPQYLSKRGYRFTLDTEADLKLLRAIHQGLEKLKEPFDAKHATILVDRTPRLMEINRDVVMKNWKQ